MKESVRHLVDSMLQQFAYLLRAMRDQKKTVVEWNALVRVALFEVNEAIAKNDLVLEGRDTVTFDEYRRFMEKIGSEMSLAAAASALKSPRDKEDPRRIGT